MKQTIGTQPSRQETETVALHAIRTFIEDEGAKHLTINLDVEAFDEGLVKVSQTGNRFTRKQVIDFVLSLRRKALDHSEHPMTARLLLPSDDVEMTAWRATNAQMVVKGKVVNVCAFGLKDYHAVLKKRRAEDQAVANKVACESIGMAFRAIRKDGTVIKNGDSELWYDIDAAIKAVCRDTWGSQWYAFGMTAQNKARKDEASRQVEIVEL